MNYDFFTQYTYSNNYGPSNGETYIFDFAGNIASFSYDALGANATMQNYLDYAVNAYYNAGYNGDVAGIFTTCDSGTYLFGSTKNCFFKFKVKNHFTISAVESGYHILDSFNDYIENMDDPLSGGYLVLKASGNGTNATATQYVDYNFSSTNISGTTYYMVFDYSNIKYNIYNEEYSNYCPITKAGDAGVGIYTFALSLNGTGPFDISVGDYFGGVYQSGYQAGEIAGYYNGFDAGSHSNISYGPTNTAFNYIGAGFTAVSNILALEILPHVTLGLCFSIPLTLVLITTIFKLVKK